MLDIDDLPKASYTTCEQCPNCGGDYEEIVSADIRHNEYRSFVVCTECGEYFIIEPSGEYNFGEKQ